MGLELEDRLQLADTVLEALAQLPATSVNMVGGALRLTGGGSVGRLGNAFEAFADGSAGLARLQIAYELRHLARDRGEFVERLDDAQEQPWVALRHALEQLRDAELEALTAIR